MQPGHLRERVAFDAPRATADGYGGEEIGWVETLVRRAQFRWLRAGPTVQAARLEGRQPVVATVRADAVTRAIATGWRMRDLGRLVTSEATGTITAGHYGVMAAVESADRMWIEVTAVAGDVDGRAAVVPGAALVLEDGGRLLIEDGAALLLEDAA